MGGLKELTYLWRKTHHISLKSKSGSKKVIFRTAYALEHRRNHVKIHKCKVGGIKLILEESFLLSDAFWTGSEMR